MDHYFTPQEGAIRRLIGIRRGSTGTSGPSIVVGRRKDGVEVNGIADVLSAVRAGRIASFFHSSPTDTHVVFVT
jgi:ABC-type amino acid transport substrate-binding protein